MQLRTQESLTSRIIKKTLFLINKKQDTVRRMERGKGFVNPKQEQPEPPLKLLKNIHSEITYIQNCPVYTLSASSGTAAHDSKSRGKDRKAYTVLYFHGGAYMASFNLFHWKMLNTLVAETNCSVVAPDYPLAPSATWKEGLAMVLELYTSLLPQIFNKQLIIMGDSAGGGLALALTQMVSQQSLPLPKRLVLLSPWLDVSMTNPLIKFVEKNDPILSVAALQSAGLLWAGGTPLTDWHISPLYCSFKGLPPISLFTGTADVLNPDAKRLKNNLLQEGIHIDYHEYPNMMHDWMFFPIPEAKRCRESLVALLKNGH